MPTEVEQTQKKEDKNIDEFAVQVTMVIVP